MMKRLGRREFLRLSGGLAGALLARPRLSFAQTDPIPGDAFGISRASKLGFPGFVVHSDLHNHSHFSGDAVGDPEQAYTQMLGAGLEVAALTDHAIMGKDHGDVTCPTQSPCSLFVGMNDDAWQRCGEIADAADSAGVLAAIRGFEWTTGTLGHINVWFTQTWTDPLHTRSLITQKGLTDFFGFLPVIGPPANEALGPTIEASPEILATMDGFYDWLGADPSRPLLGGGSDGIAGFNHPNLYGNHNDYAFDAAAAQRLVTIEAFTGGLDFLYFRESPSQPEPISTALNEGWRVGLIGVSDEHGETYGLAGMGRGGMWVSSLTRDGAREALTARRTFATREAGLRLDAAANGVRMGSALPHDSGPVTFALDIAKAGWAGKQLSVQVIRPAAGVGADIVADLTFPAPAETDPPIVLTTSIDRAEGSWVLLRVTDPATADAPHHSGTPAAGLGGAVAYSSPWFLESL